MFQNKEGFNLFSFLQSDQGSGIFDAISKHFGGENSFLGKILNMFKGFLGGNNENQKASSTIEKKIEQQRTSDENHIGKMDSTALDDQTLFNDLKGSLAKAFSHISDANLSENIQNVSNALSSMTAPEGLTQTFESVSSGKMILSVEELFEYTQELLADGMLDNVEAGMLNDALQTYTAPKNFP